MPSLEGVFGRAIREVVFGAEDGLVSIFGLVFGVAAGAASSTIVLLAGATGALSGAVSMAAGTYLSVKSERDVAEHELEEEAERIRLDPEAEEREIAEYLHDHGFTAEEVDKFLASAKRKPDFVLEVMAAHELRLGRATEEQPLYRAGWIFLAYILATIFPVLPYALFPLDLARLVSLVATVSAVVGIGIGRAAVSNGNALYTTLETLLVAALAAGAGYVAGTVVSNFTGVGVPAGA